MSVNQSDPEAGNDMLLGLDLSNIPPELAAKFEKLLVAHDDAASSLVDDDDDMDEDDDDPLFDELIYLVEEKNDKEMATTVKYMANVYYESLKEQMEECRAMQSQLRKLKITSNNKQNTNTNTKQEVPLLETKTDIDDALIDEVDEQTPLKASAVAAVAAAGDADAASGQDETTAANKKKQKKKKKKKKKKKEVTGIREICTGDLSVTNISDFMSLLLEDLENFLPPLAVVIATYTAALKVLDNIITYTDYTTCGAVEFWTRVALFILFTMAFIVRQLVTLSQKNVVKLSRRKIWHGESAVVICDSKTKAFLASRDSMFAFDWAYLVFSFLIWIGICIVFVDTTTLGCLISDIALLNVELGIILVLVAIAWSRKLIRKAVNNEVKENAKEIKREERRKRRKVKREQKQANKDQQKAE